MWLTSSAGWAPERRCTYLHSRDQTVTQVDRERLEIDVRDFPAVLPAHDRAGLDDEVVTLIVDAAGDDLYPQVLEVWSDDRADDRLAATYEFVTGVVDDVAVQMACELCRVVVVQRLKRAVHDKCRSWRHGHHRPGRRHGSRRGRTPNFGVVACVATVAGL